ncbi:MAG TPA: hypothetical protein VMS21_14290 [Methylomirabilota bacterium]|nr:hypothetical protein [Methylomirabilota bacterium]
MLSGCLLVAGCASPAIPSSDDDASDIPRNPVEVTPIDALRGRVAGVNEEVRFVVLRFPVGQMPAVGRRLYVYRDGNLVGMVRVSGPHRDINTVADLMQGNASVGDEVRDR